MTEDYSHLPVAQQPLVYRLRKRAEIRRNDKNRLSVQEGRPDKISNLLEEAADKIQQLEGEKKVLFSVLSELDQRIKDADGLLKDKKYFILELEKQLANASKNN